MADIQVGDIVRISAIMSMFGQEFVNVHHFKTIANTTVDDAEFMDQMVGILASIYNDIDDDQSDELTYERIEGQNVTGNELLPTTNWTGNPTGDDTLHPLPTQVTANVYWPTKTPRIRCTTYLPGYGETANGVAGNWTSAVKGRMQTFGDKFVGDIVAADMTVRKGAYNAAAVRFTELIAAVVPSYSRTQRRRRVGVGG